MPMITMTRDAYAALRDSQFRTPGSEWADDATPRPDGDLDVPLEAETVTQLDSLRFPQESLSDVLLRLCATIDRPLN